MIFGIIYLMVGAFKYGFLKRRCVYIRFFFPNSSSKSDGCLKKMGFRNTSLLRSREFNCDSWVSSVSVSCFFRRAANFEAPLFFFLSIQGYLYIYISFSFHFFVWLIRGRKIEPFCNSLMGFWGKNFWFFPFLILGICLLFQWVKFLFLGILVFMQTKCLMYSWLVFLAGFFFFIFLIFIWVFFSVFNLSFIPLLINLDKDEITC